jgi:hypothetical protein
MSTIRAGLTGLWVRISFFPTHEQVSVGFRVMLVPAPASRDSDPYLHPSGFVSAGTQIFRARCHLYSWLVARRHYGPHVALLEPQEGHCRRSLPSLTFFSVHLTPRKAGSLQPWQLLGALPRLPELFLEHEVKITT